jgi:voltage-gated potassium channel
MQINKKVLMYSIAIALVISYGTIGTYLLGSSGNFNVKINSALEALYFTVVTISTVGYGDITPVTPLGRIFVIILIISGLSIFLSAVTLLSSDFMSSRVEKLYSGSSRVDKRMLENHIVLIGYDNTNVLVSEKLKKQKRPFIIISGDKPTVDSLREKGYPAYLADYTLKSDMEKFALNKATDVLIDLKDNSKTVYVVLTVKKLAKNVRISVVAQSSEIETHLADLEVDRVVNPVSIAAEMLTSQFDRDQDTAYVKKKGIGGNSQSARGFRKP